MKLLDIIQTLFKRGLGELLVLHAADKNPMLGYLTYTKGKLVIKDEKYLSGIKSSQITPCWESGILGMICDSKNHEWTSLTFYGLNKCDLAFDLGKTRYGALTAAENQYGDNLLAFVGSIYRSYQLMMDNHFLPVVMLKPVRGKDGTCGLAVCDLRAAPLPLSTVRIINGDVSKSVERHLILEVEDVTLNPEQFDEIFENFLPKS
jgi:hypothetical protein